MLATQLKRVVSVGFRRAARQRSSRNGAKSFAGTTLSGDGVWQRCMHSSRGGGDSSTSRDGASEDSDSSRSVERLLHCSVSSGAMVGGGAAFPSCSTLPSPVGARWCSSSTASVGDRPPAPAGAPPLTPLARAQIESDMKQLSTAERMKLMMKQYGPVFLVYWTGLWGLTGVGFFGVVEYTNLVNVEVSVVILYLFISYD